MPIIFLLRLFEAELLWHASYSRGFRQPIEPKIQPCVNLQNIGSQDGKRPCQLVRVDGWAGQIDKIPARPPIISYNMLCNNTTTTTNNNYYYHYYYHSYYYHS